MEMHIRFRVLFLLFFIINSAHADKEKAVIPHYRAILDAQLKCSKKDFYKVPLDPALNFTLATRAWSVITDLKVTEVPRRANANPKIGASRSFDVSFRGMGYFECGKPVVGLDKAGGEQITHHEVIFLYYKNNRHLDLSDDETTYIEGWPNFTSNVESTDMPIKPDTMGFTCLVLLDDLLKNPDSIDLKKLCAGESKKKIEFTKKEIKRAIGFWKKHATDKLQKTKSEISSLIAGNEGVFAVAYRDLQDDSTIMINEKETFHAASLMKVPIMFEVFKQVRSGNIKLDDKILLKNRFKSIFDGSYFALDIKQDNDEELFKHIGKEETVRDLVYRMIALSSNLATNTLIEKVKAQKITDTMRSIGANGTTILRGVEDDKAFNAGLNNTVTAYDMMLILENIAKSEEMLKILLEQKSAKKIPAMLPKEVRVAHKTGSINGIEHNAGIIVFPDGKRYILVLLSKDLKTDIAGIEAEAMISKIIYKNLYQ